jgi:4-amino-4-deoxy-L-arabinose transferase-like glycosyltransferase
MAFCFSLAIMGFAVCWRLVRLLGGSRQTAAAAMAIVASTPALHWTASVFKDDFLMATLQVGCSACFLRWRADGSFRWILLGCWFLGSSFGVKHSALFAAVGLGLLVLQAIWQQRRRMLALAAIAVILASTASVWHVRAYRRAGDPAYPAGLHLASRAFNRPVEVALSPLTRTARLLRNVHGHGHAAIFESILPAPAGIIFGFLIPLMFLARRDRWAGSRRTIGFIVAVGFSYWLMTASNLRYVVTPLLLLACLLAVALSRACAGSSPATRRLLSGVVVYGLLFGWTGSLIIENSAPQVRYVAGLLSADA